MIFNNHISPKTNGVHEHSRSTAYTERARVSLGPAVFLTSRRRKSFMRPFGPLSLGGCRNRVVTTLPSSPTVKGFAHDRRTATTAWSTRSFCSVTAIRAVPVVRVPSRRAGFHATLWKSGAREWLFETVSGRRVVSSIDYWKLIRVQRHADMVNAL